MKNKKKIEFKKQLARFSIIIIVLSTIVSYTLAWFGLETNENLTMVIITTCFAYLITYATTSTIEKHSRNKYGIDENGIPYSQQVTKEESDTPTGG